MTTRHPSMRRRFKSRSLYTVSSLRLRVFASTHLTPFPVWHGILDALEEEVRGTRRLQYFPPRPQVNGFEALWNRRENHPDEFRRLVRMPPKAFNDLVLLIKDSQHFANDSNNPQSPVDQQLAVFLFRVGHYGNAASIDRIAFFFGISTGSVINFSNRVLQAILELHNVYVAWPGHARRLAARTYVRRSTGVVSWSGGIFATDGTTLPLFQRPSYFGREFYDRNSRYSLNSQVRIDV